MRISFLLSLLFVAGVADAQLFMPRNIAETYAKGTRSMDGKPGKNYWINHGVYDITITAAPPDRVIRGSETISYTNESPDTLRVLSMKLFQNVHRPGAARDGQADSNYLTNGIAIDNALAGGAPLRVPKNFSGINMPVRLTTPLLPKQTVQLSFDWHYTISLQSGREGMLDSTSWFLAYFYPRIAVYDDYNGFDQMPFVESHEFYSDFNDYRVTLNVPKDYVVTGTGMLQSPETVLQPAILARYNAVMHSDATINIVTKADLDARNVTTQTPMNAWKFSAQNIPDVAFAMSNHYNWDGSSALVDDATGRRAGAYAMYDDKSKDYHSVAQYARHSLDFFSHQWPGVAYPYEKTTVVQGFAGMEYPMMANDETYQDTVFSRFVAEHEIAHTYMPFYMGINETRYGFMDEGWATTFEYLIGTQDVGAAKAISSYKQFRVANWIGDHAAEAQIPIITPGDAVTGRGLGSNEYGKASLGYLAMKDMLGDEMFRNCLHAYMSRWNSKHPLPWDFFYTFDNVSGQNLDWFWKAWYFDNSYIDLALRSVQKVSRGYNLNLENIGGMPAPTDVIATMADGSTQTFHASSAIWKADIHHATLFMPTNGTIVSLKTEGGIFMDGDMTNNTLQVH